jgi:hypothetical protein
MKGDAMTRTRSPNYPALPLKAAAGLAQALWKQEKRSIVPPEVAVRAWGYASLSGPARVRLASLKRYGLLEEEGEGVRLSELAMRLALEPRESEEGIAVGQPGYTAFLACFQR